MAPSGLAARLQAVEHENRVQHDHLEAPVDRIGDAEVGVEDRIARLRHDRAVKGRCYGVRLRIAAKQTAEHSRRILWFRAEGVASWPSSR